MAVLKSNLDLFDIENHGENHIPAVIGAEPDILHLRREVLEGARAIDYRVADGAELAQDGGIFHQQTGCY